MAVEQYVDLISTTLNTTINNSTTSVIVASATGMPATGNFTLLIDDGVNKELLHVTARSGTTCTVATRGTWGTAAFSFTSGATIILVLSALAFDAIRASMSQIGPYASLPSSGMKAGDRYKATDTKFEYCYNGTIWVPLYDGLQVTEPPSSSWSFDNQGSATAANALGTLDLIVPGGSNVAFYYRTAPATPYTITMRCERVTVNMDGTNSASQDGGVVGLGFRDSGGKLTGFGYSEFVNPMGFEVDNWNSSSSFNANVKTHNSSVTTSSPFPIARRTVMHMRISDDGTNLKFLHSVNGFKWVEFLSYPRTTFMGSGPDSVGFYVLRATAETAYLYVYDWTVS